MLHSSLLLCTLYTLTVGVTASSVTKGQPVTLALNSNDRGSWNKSDSLSNDTGLGIEAGFSHFLNATGESSGSGLNTSLEPILEPSFDTYKNFSDQCLLWSDQCSGNRTEALDSFFNNSGTLYNVVYGAHCIWSRETECAPWLPSPAVLPKLLDWLREPECVQSFYEYHAQHTDQPPWTWSGRIFDGWSTQSIDWKSIATTTSSVGCCKECTVLGGNVDVYYWPVPEANYNCVSTIGSIFNNPVTELLITDNRGYPYWKAQTNPWGQNHSQEGDSITLPPQQALNGAPNPLDETTYIVKPRGYESANITVLANLSNAEAIATIGDFRCTSPSICIGFSDVYAADACGALSTDGAMVPYTLIAFAPGELSTIQIPAWVRASVPPKAAIRSFNFADLPCPPQSVMYDVEYKPAPGEPYRPVLSPPRRLSSLLPEWSKSGCIIPAALFNGVDPPRALRPAEILTPKVTQVLPTVSVTAVAAPASGIRANEPHRTPNPSPSADNVASTPSDPDTRESGSEILDPSITDPKKNGSKNTDTKAKGSEDPKIHDPSSNNVDPQEARPSIPDPENTPAVASEQSSPKLENVDPKQAGSPSDLQETRPQVPDDHYTPAKVQGSTLEVTNLDDSKADSPSPGHSQATVPDVLSHSAASGEENAGKSPPHGDSPHVSDPSGEYIPTKNPQGDGIVDSDIHNTGSLHGEPETNNSESNDAIVSAPNGSPAAETDANEDDISDATSVDQELNPFDILPAEMLDLNGALSPSAASGNGLPSKPKNAQGDSSPQSDNLEYFPSGDNRNFEAGTTEISPAPQYSAKTHQAPGPDNIDNLNDKNWPAHGSTRVPLRFANGLPQLASDVLKDPSRKTGATDAAYSATAATGASRVSGFVQSSPFLAAAFAEESGSAPSSAILATPTLGLGSDGTTSSSSEIKGLNVNSAASSEVKSSANRLLAYKRQAERNTLKSAGALFHWICIIVALPWLPVLTTVL